VEKFKGKEHIRNEFKSIKHILLAYFSWRRDNKKTLPACRPENGLGSNNFNRLGFVRAYLSCVLMGQPCQRFDLVWVLLLTSLVCVRFGGV
jgi:hypothetical protein